MVFLKMKSIGSFQNNVQETAPNEPQVVVLNQEQYEAWQQNPNVLITNNIQD